MSGGALSLQVSRHWIGAVPILLSTGLALGTLLPAFHEPALPPNLDDVLLAAFCLALAFLAAMRLGTFKRLRLDHGAQTDGVEALAADYRLMLESTDQGVLAVDAEGRCTFVNPAGARLLGFTRDELLHGPVEGIFCRPGTGHRPSDGPDGPDDPLSAVLRAGGDTARAEYVLRRRDGSRLLVDCLFVRVEGIGQPASAIIWFSDITARKRAEEALRDSELRFRSVLFSAIDAVVLADGQGRIICWNQGARTMFGYEEHEILGQPLTLLMPHRYRRRHQEGLARLRATGVSRVIGRTLTLQGVRKDGTEFPLELSLATWQTGDRTFYSGIIRDTTERERQLRQITEERERLARDLHDGIIQSVYAIGLNLTQCRRLVPEDPRQAVAGLDGAISDLNAVIREVRTYLQALTRKGGQAPDLRAEFTNLLRTLNGTPAIRFVSDIDPEAAARVQPEQGYHLLHIVREALSNSLRHGHATVGVVSLQPANGCIRLEVRDDGAGFDPDACGTRGHGLPNIRARARTLGARLEIVSSRGGGTRISVEVPVGGQDDVT